MFIVRPLFNIDRESMFDGFGPTSALVASRHVAQVTSVEESFAYFNADNRPNGRDERSLSVGDVVQVAGATGGFTFFAVKPCGFEQVTRLAVIKALRRKGTAGYSATRDERPSALPLPAAIRLADSFLTPENALEVAAAL